MTGKFEDIKIVSLDDGASGPSGQGSLFRMVLKLSASVPTEWADYFNRAWEGHFYMMKRRASASGNRIEIICATEELQSDHVPELKKIIAETNQSYREYVNRRHKEQAAKAEAEMKRKETLSNLKNNLKFD